MSEQTSLTKNRIISELSKSPHGSLKEYLPIGQLAASQEPEFLAHLIAWDSAKGQVRDAKTALPVVSLSVPTFPDQFAENSYAHLLALNPRELLKAYQFSLECKLPGRARRLRSFVSLYLHKTETNPGWQHLALQHRGALKRLYALTHTKPGDRVDRVIMKGHDYAGAPLFTTVAQLKTMSAEEAAGQILEKKIPFLIALGALGSKAKDPSLVLALINRMTPTELVTNTKLLERLGVKTNSALRGAYEQALVKASASKANILKTTRAAENIADTETKAKLQAVQDRQIASMSVEGNWLVLADKSGSMEQAIPTAREVAATLAKFVRGKVWLVFFDTSPMTIDVTGCTLDVIKAATAHIRADGGTSIGCGLDRMLQAKEELDGIAIVSDGCENMSPMFWDVYARYSKLFDKEIPVYLYRLQGSDYPHHYATFAKGGTITEFDLRRGVDFYSLPNLVTTMRTNRYSLVDEIMATPLLTLKGFLEGKYQRKEGKHASA